MLLLSRQRRFLLFWLQCPDPTGRKPRETGSTFVPSNINDVIECIDYIITFFSIWEPTEMYSLNNWKCIHERFFISVVGWCNCTADSIWSSTCVLCHKPKDSEHKKEVCECVCVTCKFFVLIKYFNTLYPKMVKMTCTDISSPFKKHKLHFSDILYPCSTSDVGNETHMHLLAAFYMFIIAFLTYSQNSALSAGCSTPLSM